MSVKGLDPDQGPNCLQILPADDNSVAMIVHNGNSITMFLPLM